MAHAEICPVCGGKGHILTDEPLRTTKKCHGCGGRGWVEVRDW